jgi:hypothetical protein
MGLKKLLLMKLPDHDVLIDGICSTHIIEMIKEHQILLGMLNVEELSETLE